MSILPQLLDILSSQQASKNKLRVHMNDKMAVLKLSEHLTALLQSSCKKEKPVVLCIGTDRSTGDSLGPLTGWHLTTMLQGTGINIFGTIDDPVHAQNLTKSMAEITENSPHQPVIAIDACLGQYTNVGTILMEHKPLKPGAGVSKILPPVGDISISGVVNVGGFMEFQILQNTRLSHVFKMSQVIADSLYLALRDC